MYYDPKKQQTAASMMDDEVRVVIAGWADKVISNRLAR